MYLPSQDTKIYVVGKPAVHTIKIYTAVQEYFIHISVNQILVAETYKT